MRLLLYGVTGMVGQRILAEAVERGHEMTAAARDPERIQEMPVVDEQGRSRISAEDLAVAILAEVE